MLIFVVATDPDVPGLCVAYDSADRVARAMCMPDLILIVDPVVKSVSCIEPKLSPIAKKIVEDYEEIYYKPGSEYIFILSMGFNTLGDMMINNWYYQMPAWCERDLVRPVIEKDSIVVDVYDHKPYGTL